MSQTPFDVTIWTADECAGYLRQEKSTFLKRTQFAVGFPPRLEIPGQPRWSAKAVANWALSRQDHGAKQQAPDSKAA